MPLIDLQTNLRDLKFGNDRVAGGSSSQPYVQSDIPTPGKDPVDSSYLNQDFILRGGLKAVDNSIKDVERLGKYFLDIRNPSGLLFIAKQNLLSRTAVRTPTSIFPAFLNEGIYTPIGTLAQAGGVAFGLHTNKQGLNPFAGIGNSSSPTPKRYWDVMKVNSDPAIFGGDDVLDRLRNSSEPNTQRTEIGKIYEQKITQKNNSFSVKSYPGGPGSVLGIGKTQIYYATDNAGVPLKTGINNADLKFSNFLTPITQYGGVYGRSTFNSTTTEIPAEFGVRPPVLTKSALPDELEEGVIFQISPASTTTVETGDQRIQISEENNWNYNYSVFKRKSPIINGNTKLGASKVYIYNNWADTTEDFRNAFNGFYNESDDNFGEVNPDYRGGGSLNVVDSTVQSINDYTDANNITEINALNLLGASTSDLFQFNLPLSLNTASANGFNTSGSIDSTISNRGSLNNKDISLSTLSSKQEQSSRTLVFNQTDLYDLTYNNIPTNPNLGTSFLISNKEDTNIIGDFRRNIRNKLGITGTGSNQSFTNKTITAEAKYVGNLAAAPNYYKKDIETRVKLGYPGDTTMKNILSYTQGFDGSGSASPFSFDLINASEVGSEFINDLVKFRIQVIDNDKPSRTTNIQFRAFLDNISDSFSADWKGEKYVGRGENFYNYSGFDRKVSLGWTVAAQSKAELIPMYKKLSYLASICAPDYSTTGYMRGNIVKLTIGGYFFEQPGIITGFSYDMNDDSATWEIAIDDDGDYDSSVKELPHLIKVKGFNFIPIHTFTPQLGLHEDSPFIALTVTSKPQPIPTDKPTKKEDEDTSDMSPETQQSNPTNNPLLKKMNEEKASRVSKYNQSNPLNYLQ